MGRAGKGGEWRGPDYAITQEVCEAAGVDPERARVMVWLLDQAGMLVRSRYYVPSLDELADMYYTLGMAYLLGRIKVRWVMCAETRDALAQRYAPTRTVMPVMHDPYSWNVLTPRDRWGMPIRELMVMEPDRLLGVPIRIDPAARRPMFEMIEKGGDDAT